MSHELRTPLNTILILGQQLAENPEGNLTGKQVEFARTIHGAGTDLLNLITDILDLSKIESGTVTVEAEEVFFANLLDMRRPHLPARGREPRPVVRRPGRSAASAARIVTDSKRLQQVLKNLLSNAFKFTAQGGVRLNVSAVSRRLDARPSGPQPGGARRRLRGLGHRHRHPAREAADHLRGVPAGRRQHQPQVRRHRPRPGHQPRAGQPARRRDPAAQHPGRRQHVHALPAAALRRADRPSAAARAARADAGQRRAARCRSRGCPSGRSRWSPTTATTSQPGDPIAADRRGRPALRAHPGRPRARQGLQGAGRRRAAPTRWRWRASSGRPRSRSTSSCPTCSAGRC